MGSSPRNLDGSLRLAAAGVGRLSAQSAANARVVAWVRISADDRDHELVIYGAWYLAEVIEELATSIGWTVIGRVDPNPPEGIHTLDCVPPGSQCFAAVGDNARRELVSRGLDDNGRKRPTLVHPSSVISPSAAIGAGTYIGENVVVRARAVVGTGVILNAGAVVSHHCQVGDYTTLGPNAAMSGRSIVGRGCLIGVGASVLPARTIDDRSTVGAGSVVTRDVPADCVVAGNPARRTVRSEPRADDTQSDWRANSVW